MKKWWNFAALIGASLSVSSCVDPYEPEIITEAQNYLVIEGALNSGAPTELRLSRTVGLADPNTYSPERFAVVSVESDGGNMIYLTGNANGIYTAPDLDLNPAHRYRLRIQTNTSGEYLSDYVTLKPTPPIDSIHWVQTAEGVQLYVNTHDPLGSTRYYRWEYEETWEVRAPYRAEFEYVDRQIVPRDPIPPRLCWAQENSAQVLIGSSARLVRDVIFNQPLVFIPHTSWKLSQRYSLLAKQYALSREAFEYYQQLKKNTEETGSFFDPLPVELRGNIYSVNNAQEPVIGYFDAGSVQEQRIYIDGSEVNPWGYRVRCDIVMVSPDSLDFYFGGGTLQPLYKDDEGNYYGSENIDCYDCSAKANPVKPDFWE
ncbi:DUF4249 domain-containing protein [Cesiribacter andamanensis]|uniref:DUF4249 domain-containing protein n=1 Tax=Cesiribacter andamanensis AMV16 TaxID=1279009 RepID=M7NI40_9BACT|nr:DUF4249 domain-containing protein [Cesiribacter andamanensis]EMR01475.1 hypothetical protein ADICEAN_03406 [Cesiribacter andamanensis AMV16]